MIISKIEQSYLLQRTFIFWTSPWSSKSNRNCNDINLGRKFLQTQGKRIPLRSICMYIYLCYTRELLILSVSFFVPFFRGVDYLTKQNILCLYKRVMELSAVLTRTRGSDTAPWWIVRKRQKIGFVP